MISKKTCSTYIKRSISLPEDVSLKLFERVSEVPEQWNQLLPENHHLHTIRLAIYEESGLEDLAYRYACLYKSNKLVGVMYFQILQFNHKHLRGGNFPSRWFAWFLQCRSIPLLVCGNLFALKQQGFYLTDPSDQMSLMYTLNSVASAIGACGILIKDCQQPILESLAHYNQFEPWGNDLTMTLTVDSKWEHFDDYLSSLGRKYLQRAKKIIKAGASIERRKLTQEDIAQHHKRIGELYLQVSAKQSLKLGYLNSHYFRLMQMHLKSEFQMIGYYSGDALVGFRTTLIKNEAEEIHYIGFDQETNKANQLYFNMLFDGLSDAIKRKSKKLELGRTALDAKASLGARPETIQNYIQIRNPIASWMFKSISGKFTQEAGDTWKQRNPFKDR